VNCTVPVAAAVPATDTTACAPTVPPAGMFGAFTPTTTNGVPLPMVKLTALETLP